MQHPTPSPSTATTRRPDYFGLAASLVREEIDSHFGYGTDADQPSEADIDAMYVEEMERRQQPPVRFEPFETSEPKTAA